MAAPVQPFDVDRLEAQIRRAAADFGDERVEVGARPDEARRCVLRCLAAGLLDDGQYAAGFLGGNVSTVAFNDRMDGDAAVGACRPGDGRFGIAHGARFRLSAAGKCPGTSR